MIRHRSGLFLALILLASNAGSATMTRTIRFDGPGITGSGDDVELRVRGCRVAAPAGAPAIPVYPAVFLLPPGSDFSSLEIRPLAERKLSIPGTVAPAPVQSSLGRPWSGGPPRDPAIYASDAFWPPSSGEVATVQTMAGMRVLFVNIYPCRPAGSGGSVMFTPELEVEIETDASGRSGLEAPGFQIRRALDLLEPMIENPETAGLYDPFVGDAQGGYVSSSPRPYVIITSPSLADALAPLAELKMQFGLRSEIVTTDWIASSFEGFDLQEKIRSFISYAWMNWQTEFVLLGGDTGTVPHRSLYVKAGMEIEPDIPSDMYYACLDGSWDGDGDGIFGEPGEEDLLPEVSVGRLPVDSEEEAADFMAKMISYSLTPPVEACSRALMAGELLWSIDGIETWGGDFKDEIVSGSDAWGLNTSGLSGSSDVETLYDRDIGTWGAADIAARINDGVAVINHLGHSNQHMVMRMSIYDLALLDNGGIGGMPFVCYSQGCYPASFDNRDDAGVYHDADAVGEQLVTGPDGAVAFVGNARLGWNSPGSTCGVSQFFDRQFFDAVYGEGIMEIGRALDDSRIDNIPFISYPAVRYVMYNLALIGDPSLGIWTAAPVPLTVVHAAGIRSGRDVLEVSVTGGSGPIEGARVSLFMDECDAYFTELTGCDGTADIFTDLPSAGQARLVAYFPGCPVYSAFLEIVEPEEPMPGIAFLGIDDDSLGSSAGDGDGILESGETAELGLIIRNASGTGIPSLLVSLHCHGGELSVLDDTLFAGDLPARASLICEGAFLVEAPVSVPDGCSSNLDMVLSSGEDSWTARQVITIGAPAAVLDSWTLSEDESGNGNGCIEAWEFLDISCRWKNTGSVDITAPELKISCPDDGWVRVVKRTVELPDIPAGGSVTSSGGLELFIREKTPPFTSFDVTFTLTSGGMVAGADTITAVSCGYGLEDPAEAGSPCLGAAVTGPNGWSITDEDCWSEPSSWKCGGGGGEAYPNMMENVLLAPPVCLFDNSTLTFMHRMGAEAGSVYPYWAQDGAIVEISTDGGETWQAIEPVGGYPCRAASSNTIFLSPYQRCYSGEIPWREETFDLSSFRGPVLLRFHFASDEQYGFEGWYIDDIRIATERTTDAGEDTPPGGAVTALMSPWPNPFNPSVNIPFSLAAEGPVELSIFDVSGRLVRLLVDRPLPAGPHSASWDGRNDAGKTVSSGVYFCRMSAGIHESSHRLVLMR